MQRENERGRLVVEGWRTDDNALCSLVVVHEVGGTWAAYPHGAAQLGVRLPRTEAVKVAQTILNDAMQSPDTKGCRCGQAR